MKRYFVLLAVALALTLGLAQETHHLETRLSIVEDRLGRLEGDVGRLREVPTTLARIEEKLAALTERQGSTGGLLETIGVGIILSVITGALAYNQGVKRRSAD